MIHPGDEPPFLIGVGGGMISCLATILKANRTATVSETHPYNSLIRAMASISCGVNRMVVCFDLLFMSAV